MVICAVLLAVLLAVFRTRLRALDIFWALLLFGTAVLSILIVLYTRREELHSPVVRIANDDLEVFEQTIWESIASILSV